MGLYDKGTKKHVSVKSDMPTGDHYAIMEFSSINIPGDERSRTNPGHGYPAYTDHFIRYIAFTDKAEWEREVQERTNSKYGSNDFVATFVKQAKVSTTVSVAVDI